jgi:hypothetical protein
MFFWSTILTVPKLVGEKYILKLSFIRIYEPHF